ncbi:homoserine O-acetyltransferase MetX [Terracidiphilus gabretensis]|uniref:homoserine O-acetyltransferase MetX n=1 Tax=Terracidiphilus gabretensis TaxID=1577687 RepID=UPI0009E98E07|nr:homoserine O-acetyltransferase [Terracidiphilus gabretensis]
MAETEKGAEIGAAQTTENTPPKPRTPTPAPTYEGDYVLNEHLLLECGRTLAGVTLHYAVYGKLNAARDNAVLVCHALSGSALVGEWWPEVFGPGALLSLEHDFVICINLLGSCYGSTGPSSVNPETGEPYGADFPLVSIHDNVRAQSKLLDSLGIRKLRLVMGGSLGGMQALEWTIQYPTRVEKALIVGVAPLGAMGLALNHLQREAIRHDPDWQNGGYLPQKPPRRGLSLARQIAMLSYKSGPLFDERFARNPNRNGENPWGLDDFGGGLIGGRFDIAGYLDEQGRRFVERFEANSYLAILRTMDTWDPLRGGNSSEEIFGKIKAQLTFVGINSDWLFPHGDVRRFAETIRSAGVSVDYREMTSDHGHDAFLAEQVDLVRLLQ